MNGKILSSTLHSLPPIYPICPCVDPNRITNPDPQISDDAMHPAHSSTPTTSLQSSNPRIQTRRDTVHGQQQNFWLSISSNAVPDPEGGKTLSKN